jgi:putative Mg2+ transporter-C (MgtC) family protein
MMDFFINQFDFEIMIKLGVTAVLGLIIGLEREIKRKPLGLKTCLVISIVSCLLTIVSIESAYSATSSVNGINITMDPLRLAAQIVSGIGFLGAGVILRRGNDSISGLTTAAIIWGAAGIGIAVGAGFYIEAITGAVLIMISVELIPFIMSFIGPKQLKEKDISLEIVVEEKKYIDKIIDRIQENKISINRTRIRDLKEGGQVIQIKISVNMKKKTTDIYYLVSELEGVKQVEIES